MCLGGACHTIITKTKTFANFMDLECQKSFFRKMLLKLFAHVSPSFAKLFSQNAAARHLAEGFCRETF